MTIREPDDRELDALLNGRSDLSTTYRRASVEEPPAHLDAAIRAAARREAGSRPGKSMARDRWVMPAAAAAVLVVGFSLAVLVRDDPPPLAEKGDIAAAKGLRPVGASADAAAPKATADRAAQSVAAPAVTSKLQAASAPAGSDGESRLRDERADRSKGGAVNSVPAPMGTGSLSRELDKDAAPARPRASGATAAPMTAPAAPAGSPPAAAEPGVPASVTEAERLHETNVQKSKSEIRSMETRQSAAEELKLRSEEAAVAPVQRRSDVKPPDSTGNAVAAKKQGTEVPRDPEEWIRDIVKLRQQGKFAEADRSLEEFRRTYPDYPLPRPNP
jgi:hypothetical protein